MLSITAPLSERLAYCAELVKADELIEAVADAEAFRGFLDNNGFKDDDEAQIAIDAGSALQEVIDGHFLSVEELSDLLDANKKLTKLAEELVRLRFCPTAHDDDLTEAFSELETFLKK